MDTTWFAVDRDGLVGMFDTGEAGAAPELAPTEEDGDSVVEALDALAVGEPRGGWLVDPAAGQTPGAEQGPSHCRFYQTSSPTLENVVMFLESLEPVREAIQRGHAVEIPSAEGVAVRWKRLPAGESQRLHEGGACRYCYREYHDIFAGDDPEVTRRSRLFAYEHQTENWISGPYARTSQPRRPLRLEELPPAAREALGAAQFLNLSFSETPYLQPMEHFQCVTWETAWLSSDGKRIRPVPGMEEEYRNAYLDYADTGEYEVEPPAGGIPERPAGGADAAGEVIRDTPAQGKRWWEFWR